MEFITTIAGTALGLVVLVVFYVPALWRRIARWSGGQRRSQKRRIKAAHRVQAKIESLDSFPKKIAYLRKIDPFVFEELVLNAFRRRGCPIQRNRRYTGDGGVDGQVLIRGHLYLIQSKRYRRWINAQHVRDFSRLVDQYRCRGIFVHTGRTGRLSTKLAHANADLSIISGQQLIDLLKSTDHENPSDLSDGRNSKLPANTP